MRSLDTNIVLRLLLGDLPEETEKIVRIIEAEGTASLVVEDVVFFETVWVLSRAPYHLGRDTIGRALQKITNIAQIKCNRPLIAMAIPLYIKHPKLSFIDICLTIYAEQRRATPLLTLDQSLAKTLPNASLAL